MSWKYYPRKCYALFNDEVQLTCAPTRSLVESELHDRALAGPSVLHVWLMIVIDQGARERLSRTWMPLDKFTSAAMEGLCRGDAQIPVGYAVSSYDKYENGKLEDMLHRGAR